MSSKNPSLWRRDGEEAKHEAGLPAILAKRAKCHDSTPPKKLKRMKRNFSFLIEAEMGGRQGRGVSSLNLMMAHMLDLKETSNSGKVPCDSESKLRHTKLHHF